MKALNIGNFEFVFDKENTLWIIAHKGEFLHSEKQKEITSEMDKRGVLEKLHKYNEYLESVYMILS